MTDTLVSIFFQYVALSMSLSLLGVPLAFLRSGRRKGSLLAEALEFGFVGSWVAVGHGIARATEILIDLLDGDRDGDGSWRDGRTQAAAGASAPATPSPDTGRPVVLSQRPARRAA